MFGTKDSWQRLDWRNVVRFASLALFALWSLGFTWPLLAQPPGHKTFLSPAEAGKALFLAAQVAWSNVIGMSRVPLFRLVMLNAIGAAIWAPLIAGAGYLLGNTLELVLADVKRYEELVFALLAFLGLLAWIVRRHQ